MGSADAWRENLIALLYPRRCPVCDDVVEEGAFICPVCEGELSYIEEPVCFGCGKALLDPGQEYCEDCRERKRSFQWNTALLSYHKAARQSVSRFKYENRREYADFYAEEIWKRYGGRLSAVRPQAVVPVPVHPSRLPKRGYNQAEVLAERLARKLSVPVRTDLLRRNRRTLAQKRLGAAERYRNLAEAFEAAREETALRRVLLVDDIYTTGATMESCSRILQGMGAEQVYGVTICAGRAEDVEN